MLCRRFGCSFGRCLGVLGCRFRTRLGGSFRGRFRGNKILGDHMVINKVLGQLQLSPKNMSQPQNTPVSLCPNNVHFLLVLFFLLLRAIRSVRCSSDTVAVMSLSLPPSSVSLSLSPSSSDSLDELELLSVPGSKSERKHHLPCPQWTACTSGGAQVKEETFRTAGQGVGTFPAMSARDTSGSAPQHSHPHNNTMSRNEKFWVDQVTPPPPPGERQGVGNDKGGGYHTQSPRENILGLKKAHNAQYHRIHTGD